MTTFASLLNYEMKFIMLKQHSIMKFLYYYVFLFNSKIVTNISEVLKKEQISEEILQEAILFIFNKK